MPRVRWSATLEQDDVSSQTSSVMGRTRKSSLKPPSMGQPRRKSKQVVRKERQRRQNKKDDNGAEAWRERGKLYRAKLIMKDEESGGDAFTLSDDCEIEKYYDVAERVLEQFLNTTVEDKAKLTEAYLVGNRLVKFVSRVLPTHHEYFSPDHKLVALRSQSQAQLVQLLQYLEELALIIDEEEYQAFVLENQERNALSGEEPSYSSDEVSSLGGEEEPSTSFGEGPSFAGSDAAQGGVNESQNLEDFEQAPTESRIRAIQNQDSKSWDQAFSDQIAPQLPELEPQRKKKQQEEKEEELFPRESAFEVEWNFPTDFNTVPTKNEQQDVGRIDTSTSSGRSLPVDFTNSNTWPSEPEQDTTVSSTVWIRQDQRQGPDSSFTSSPEHEYKPPQKMTLRPKALYGSPSSSEREQSPKSVVDLPELMPERKGGYAEDSSPPGVYTSGSVDGYLQRVDVEHPAPSVDMSALSGEEEEASLTGAPMRRRRRMGHFKGCVRCLLE